MANDVEINIKVDEYVSVKLKIPTELDVMTLQGILQRVEKITKVSTNLPVSLNNSKVNREYIPRKSKTNYPFASSKEEFEKYNEKYKSASSEEKEKMAEELGISKDRLRVALNYYNKRYGIGAVAIPQGAGSRAGVRVRNWTEEEDKILDDFILKGNDRSKYQELANQLGRTFKSVEQRIYGKLRNKK